MTYITEAVNLLESMNSGNDLSDGLVTEFIKSIDYDLNNKKTQDVYEDFCNFSKANSETTVITKSLFSREIKRILGYSTKVTRDKMGNIRIYTNERR